MSEPDNKSEKDFKVVDNRLFTSEGEDRKPDRPVPPEPEASTHPAGSDDSLPPASFAMLVIQLASPAAIFLGEMPDPTTGKNIVNPAAARHYIDLLGILEDKTSGRLSNEESMLLKHVLTDLRMKFVEKSKTTKVVQ